MASPSPASRSEPGIHVSLTHETLNPIATMAHVRSPSAGAIVLFAGTTRDTFSSRPVLDLQYQAYVPLALTTLYDIAAALKRKHSLHGIAVVHRLGGVPIGEESILIAVSSAHRQAAWRAGEECLEEVKARAEIWKLERFVDDEGGVWRANRDGAIGVREAEEKRAVEEQTKQKGNEKGDGVEGEEEREGEETMPQGPIIRPRRPGEVGHGAVVNSQPNAPL
ncbi:hypothetical protein N0V93_009384 [Gnomoniopsis smithogilvyi]|uniref:Molybdopterin synthase catalytic subunit n=1 Tax=Gnomoniopsis smithogilvyi TaxID=1191159 RepID=A0A9W9CTM8_9PEZI|nr:hypothetical protein N0V93_009384 [Gnomoniopsis smithogilvyi]